MSVEVVFPSNEAAMAEFLSLRNQVYKRKGVWSISPLEILALLQHKTPFSEGRHFHILIARDRNKTVGRAVSVIDERYTRHWGEALGHIIMFEALSKPRIASRLLIDTACEWLRGRGLLAVRAGYGPFEPGFVIDEYQTFLKRMMRHNPPYYHSLLKDAGFETERGAGEYIIKVCPELVPRYQAYLDASQRGGYNILPLGRIPAIRRVDDFTRTWNEAYKAHWGLAPVTEGEFDMLFEHSRHAGIFDSSAIAYRDGEPAGVVLVSQDTPARSAARWWFKNRSLNEIERLSSFALGVSPKHRARGVGLGLASYAYLKMIHRGAKYLSYGLVQDDNWSSRRTAGRLGAYASANYLTYRRAL